MCPKLNKVLFLTRRKKERLIEHFINYLPINSVETFFFFGVQIFAQKQKYDQKKVFFFLYI